MNARERKMVLVALLFSAGGGAAYWQFYIAPATVANAAQGAGGPAVPPASRIQTDLMGGSGARASAGRNPFSFERPVVNVPPPPVTLPTEAPPPPPPILTRPPAPPVTTTVAPVNNVPSVTLLYAGFARDEANRMVAFLETNGQGAPAGHYNLREDDFLLGRFRVNKITPDSVEVEDLDRAENASNRKQTININNAIAQKR